MHTNMVDIERVVTLDELMDRVPEHLVREAETKLEVEPDEFSSTSSENHNMSKDQSKSQRIRIYLEANPEARNRDVVEALAKYNVKAADVANVKAYLKRTGAEVSPKKKSTAAASSKPGAAPSATATLGVPNVNLNHLQAAVSFVKLVGSVNEAQQLLTIVELVKTA
jgi:hypothetical protein